jgi:hypothetical protein
MAHKCRAIIDDPWKSKINNVAEGDITIGPESGIGNFQGRHHGKSKDLAGQCFEASEGRLDKIIFLVPPDHPEYVYVGIIYDSGKKIRGRRYTFAASLEASISGQSQALEPDEPWTAEKTT